MTTVFSVVVIGIVVVLFLRGPRLRLDDSTPAQQVPATDDLQSLATWLEQHESGLGGLIPGTEAHIQWARPDHPERTPLVFLYLHGFSATWQETHPVTEELATHYNANILQGRIAGHGFHDQGMEVPATDWLRSARDHWDLACQLGDRVVVVATSTGAPLGVWISQIPGAVEKLHAFLFMAPNFKVNNPAAAMLTWPWAAWWAQLIVGKTRRWVPDNDLQEKYWTYEYSTNALLEMQSVVDWFQNQNLDNQKTPMAVMYMRNDPVVSSRAAVVAFNAWGSDQKRLIPVEIDGDESQHVFVGDIMAPRRTDWVVTQFKSFLESLDIKA